MKHFLIVYDQAAGLVVRLDEFNESDRDAALAERFRLEGESLADQNLEILVLGADSLEQLLATHSRYFKTVDELARG